VHYDQAIGYKRSEGVENLQMIFKSAQDATNRWHKAVNRTQFQQKGIQLIHSLVYNLQPHTTSIPLISLPFSYFYYPNVTDLSMASIYRVNLLLFSSSLSISAVRETTALLVLHGSFSTLDRCFVSKIRLAHHTTEWRFILEGSSKGTNCRFTPNVNESFLGQEEGLEGKHGLHYKRLGELELQVEKCNDTNTSHGLNDSLLNFCNIII
jgi:hypothetical protein